MPVREVIQVLNSMVEDGVVETYAIGGAVAATFYLEPVATIDIDVFIGIQPKEGSVVLDPQPVFAYLAALGYRTEREYVRVGDWPVQFLAAGNALVVEALAEALTMTVAGVPARVFTAEHLAAICLQTGRAKDKSRLLQFIEGAALDANRFQDLVQKHGLTSQWKMFAHEFLEEGHDV